MKSYRFSIAVLLSLSILLPQSVPAATTLPPLAEESVFLSKVDEQNYPAAAAPASAPLLRWNFSPDTVYAYIFKQTTVMNNRADRAEREQDGQEAEEQLMRGTGSLLLQSGQNNTADLKLDDFVMTVDIELPGSGETRELDSEIPAVRIQGITEDGGMENSGSSPHLLLKTLFSLPGKALAVGESESTTTTMPLNIIDRALEIKGLYTITLLAYVDIEGKICAKLQTDINLNEIKAIEGKIGSFSGQFKGRSVFYFNLEDRHFIEGKVALLISMRAENLPAGASTPGTPAPESFSMDSDNLISVNLIAAEAE